MVSCLIFNCRLLANPQELLRLNNMKVSGSKSILVDRVVDGMTSGAVPK